MTQWGIDTLFNPGKRHMDEEKRRLQSTREEVGDSSGGRRIDLESGTVTISRRKDGPAADAAPEAEAAPAAEAAPEAEAVPEADPEGAEVAEAEPDDTEPDEAESAEGNVTDADADETEPAATPAAAQAAGIDLRH